MRSIGITTYDLLRYHSCGTYQLFDRCFEKSLTYHSIYLSDQTQRTYRRFLHHHLRTIGYIDSCSSSRINWSVSPPSLVQRDNDFALIGGTLEENSIADLLSPSSISFIDSPTFSSLPASTALLPHLMVMLIDMEEAKGIAKTTGLTLSLNYQVRLLSVFPSLGEIISKTLSPIENVILEPDTTQFMDPDTLSWSPYNLLSIDLPGLYKQLHPYSSQTSYILVSKDQNAYRIHDPEWAFFHLFLAHGKRLILQYDHQQRTLAFDKPTKEFRFPSLLERCLRSGSLTPPTRIGDTWYYTKIEVNSLRNLAKKIPILEVHEK